MMGKFGTSKLALKIQTLEFNGKEKRELNIFFSGDKLGGSVGNVTFLAFGIGKIREERTIWE